MKFDNGFLFVENKLHQKVLLETIEIFEECGRDKSFDRYQKINIEKPGKKRKILLQRLGGLGDMIFVLPLAEYFHSLGHEVDFYGHYAFWQVLRGNPFINKIWINGLLQARADGDTSVPDEMTVEQYGTYDRPYSFLGSIEANKKAEFVHATEACYDYIGIDPKGKPMKPVIVLEDREKSIAYHKLIKLRGYDPNKKFIGIAPKATAYNRSYQHGEWLAEELEDDYNVVILHHGQRWTPEDPKAWDLREAIAVVGVMDLMITTDTGMLHVAGCMDIPTLALFGCFDPDLRTKYYPNCDVICHTKDLEVCGDFCYNHIDECKKLNRRLINPPCLDIHPNEVIERVKGILNA